MYFNFNYFKHKITLPHVAKGCLKSLSSTIVRIGEAETSLPLPAMNFCGCGQNPVGSKMVKAKEREEEANLDPGGEDSETTGEQPWLCNRAE